MPTTSAPTSPVGVIDDSSAWGGILLDLLEYVPDLTWPLSVRTYAQMRVDPQLAGVLAAYALPLRRAGWAIDPAGVRPEVARLVADDLGLPVAGEDQPGAARRRGVNWSEHVRMATRHLTFGHMPFELQAEIRGGQARLTGLLERMPTAITAINTNSDGSLKSIQQPRPIGAAKDPEVIADRLLWYAHEREGSAWQGQSVLRPAFGAWLIKHEMWRVHATSNRRFGMGVPSVEAPPGATPAQVAQAQQLASNMRAGDTAGAGLPPGFKLALTGITGSTPDTLAFINYLDRQMSRMALAGILDLGDSPNGSRALGAEFVDLFMYALQAIADSMAATLTAQAAVRIVDWNWGTDEPAPRVVVGDVGADRQVTAQALNSLLTAGALSADPALEAWVRREFKLPERADTEAAAGSAPIFKYDLDLGTATVNDRRRQLGLEPVEGGDVPAALYLQSLGLAVPGSSTDQQVMAEAVRRSSGRRTDQAAAAAPSQQGPVSLRRQPTAIETAAATDFAAVQQQWQDAVEQVVADWQDKITPGQVDALITQIEAAVKDDDMAALGSLSVDSQAGADLLAEVMTTVAKTAASSAADEAKSQNVTAPVGTADADALIQVAKVTTTLLASGLASSAARAALQNWGPNLTPAEVGAAVRSQLESLTGTSLSDAVGSALSTAQHAGRMATFAAAPVATYYASEILDTNTCAPCLDEDGHEFASLAEAEDAYASGGYAECEGGLRCRGVLIAIWSDAAKQAA